MTSETRLISIIGIPAAASFQSLGIAHADLFGIAERLGPVTKGSGFAMDGWFIWCGSVVKVGNAYHMFAARWPEATKFPDGYRANSEFVRAVAPRAEGPYVFQEVALGPRAAGKWDSAMAHNPVIYKVGDTFVLITSDPKPARATGRLASLPRTRLPARGRVATSRSAWASPAMRTIPPRVSSRMAA